MERRRLGRTGHESSVAILGGAAFWMATPAEGAAGLQLALSRGVNHLDIAPQYGDAQAAVSPAIPAGRDQLFFAAKTLRSNPDGVSAQFDASRQRLATDLHDLSQAQQTTTQD